MGGGWGTMDRVCRLRMRRGRKRVVGGLLPACWRLKRFCAVISRALLIVRFITRFGSRGIRCLYLPEFWNPYLAFYRGWIAWQR